MKPQISFANIAILRIPSQSNRETSSLSIFNAEKARAARSDDLERDKGAVTRVRELLPTIKELSTCQNVVAEGQHAPFADVIGFRASCS